MMFGTMSYIRLALTTAIYALPLFVGSTLLRAAIGNPVPLGVDIFFAVFIALCVTILIHMAKALRRELREIETQLLHEERTRKMVSDAKHHGAFIMW